MKYSNNNDYISFSVENTSKLENEDGKGNINSISNENEVEKFSEVISDKSESSLLGLEDTKEIKKGSKQVVEHNKLKPVIYCNEKEYLNISVDSVSTQVETSND